MKKMNVKEFIFGDDEDRKIFKTYQLYNKIPLHCFFTGKIDLLDLSEEELIKRIESIYPKHQIGIASKALISVIKRRIKIITYSIPFIFIILLPYVIFPVLLHLQNAGMSVGTVGENFIKIGKELSPPIHIAPALLIIAPSAGISIAKKIFNPFLLNNQHNLYIVLIYVFGGVFHVVCFFFYLLLVEFMYLIDIPKNVKIGYMCLSILLNLYGAIGYITDNIKSVKES